MFDVGDRIGDVEVVARLRAGGMAALYLGRREGAGGFSKELAIKVIHSHLATDRSFVEMFVDEARLSARIDHPNVVRVEALRELDGSYCLLMEFVHGCSLSQLMGTLKERDLRFSPELAVAIAIRVADGLHAAHELLNPDGSAAGVVHRDVSPANVLVGYRGDVKLIDFGIAKASQRLHQTEAAGLKGKIAYMAPEQAFGRDVDRRCDIYALAIVLWEMLTMRRLFRADNDLRLLDMVRDPKVVPPSAVVPGIPPALDKVILQALGPTADARPPTARDFRYRLLDALPSAAAVDPLQISAVICDVMQDKIAEDRELLSLSSFNGLGGLSAADSITVSRLLRPVSRSVEVELESVAHDASSLAAGLPSAESRAEPPTLLPTNLGVGEFAPPPPAEANARRRMLPGVLGAAAILGMAFGGGGAFAAFAPSDSAAEVAVPVVAQPRTDPPPAVAEPATTVSTPAVDEPAAVPPEVVVEPVAPPIEPADEEAEEPLTLDDPGAGRRRRRRRRAPTPVERQPQPQPLGGAGGATGTTTTRPPTGTTGPPAGGSRRGGRPGITDWEI